MKNYLVKKIHLAKYIFLIIVLFIAISILAILINHLTFNIDVNLILIIDALVFAFLILPKIKKTSSTDLVIKISKEKICFNEFKIDITKIDYIKIVYEFIIFPKIIIGFNNGNKHSFRIMKFEADYHSLVNELNIINNSKLICK